LYLFLSLEYSFFETCLISIVFNYFLGAKGGKVIFREKIIQILNKKKTSSLAENRIAVVTKLKKHERLTHDEFWKVYESIHQKGPSVKYINPQTWVGIDE
jgi:hypothetical protein